MDTKYKALMAVMAVPAFGAVLPVSLGGGGLGAEAGAALSPPGFPALGGLSLPGLPVQLPAAPVPVPGLPVPVPVPAAAVPVPKAPVPVPVPAGAVPVPKPVPVPAAPASVPAPPVAVPKVPNLGLPLPIPDISTVTSGLPGLDALPLPGLDALPLPGLDALPLPGLDSLPLPLDTVTDVVAGLPGGSAVTGAVDSLPVVGDLLGGATGGAASPLDTLIAVLKTIPGGDVIANALAGLPVPLARGDAGLPGLDLVGGLTANLPVPLPGVGGGSPVAAVTGLASSLPLVSTVLGLLKGLPLLGQLLGGLGRGDAGLPGLNILSSLPVPLPLSLPDVAPIVGGLPISTVTNAASGVPVVGGVASTLPQLLSNPVFAQLISTLLSGGLLGGLGRTDADSDAGLVKRGEAGLPGLSSLPVPVPVPALSGSGSPLDTATSALSGVPAIPSVTDATSVIPGLGGLPVSPSDLLLVLATLPILGQLLAGLTSTASTGGVGAPVSLAALSSLLSVLNKDPTAIAGSALPIPVLMKRDLPTLADKVLPAVPSLAEGSLPDYFFGLENTGDTLPVFTVLRTLASLNKETFGRLANLQDLESLQQAAAKVSEADAQVLERLPESHVQGNLFADSLNLVKNIVEAEHDVDDLESSAALLALKSLGLDA